jgi:hypothetical protein
MNRSACFRPCALLLVLSLLAPPAFAAPQEPGEGGLGALAVLWHALADLLPSFSDLGPGMDPAGTPNQETADLGPTMDPAGTPHD